MVLEHPSQLAHWLLSLDDVQIKLSPVLQKLLRKWTLQSDELVAGLLCKFMDGRFHELQRF